MHKKVITYFLFCFFSFSSFAAHIVGGEMYYECLGSNQYRITLKVYRDCNASGPNVAGFDDPAYIGIYDANGSLLETVEAYLTSGPTNIPPVTNDPCLQAPANVCVEEGAYSFTRTLTPATGGYDIVYIRCCRNATIVNIVTPDEVGATYMTHIPDPGLATCNSSPSFDNFPPIVICANEPISFDHSATDPDGDQLVYELCTPFSGASSTDPQPTPPFFLSPLNNVIWRGPYNVNNPLGGSPMLSIDPQTGMLSGTPNLIGQFVVGVCVKEYRNGTLIGQTKRDFQFNVTLCQTEVQAIIPVIDTIGAAATHTAGVYVRQCDGFDVQFVNNSINGTTYAWDFGDTTTTTDVSSLFQPAYTYPDTGNYIATLIVNPGSNCADTTAVLVKIYPVFNTDFSFIAGCENEPVQFSDMTTTSFGNIDSWSWNFGDGGASQIQDPQYNYSQSGSFLVTLVSTSDKGCEDISSKSVTVHPTPEVDFDFSPPCLNTAMDLTDFTSLPSGNIASWQWEIDGTTISSSSNPSHSFSALGDYDIKLIVTSNQGCIDSLEQTVTVNPPPQVTTSNDTAICIGEHTQLFATGGDSYNWSPGDGLSSTTVSNPVASPPSSTDYMVTVVDSNLCRETADVFVTVNPLPATYAGKDTFICEQDSFRLQGSGGVSFAWSPGAVVSDSTVSDPITAPANTTDFVLTSFNIFGCRNRDTMTLEVQHPITALVTEDPDICEGDSVLLTASGGKYYEWQPDDGLTSNLSAEYLVRPRSSPAVYTVFASNDCVQFADTATVTITVHSKPEVYAGLDDSMLRDEFVYLDGRGSGTDYFWTPEAGLTDPNSLTTAASPFNTTEYILTMISEYGCMAKDTVRINVEVVNLLAVPTAFSPNGDGVNDYFKILRYLNVEKLLEFKVFNRWGNMVYSTDNINGQWDGFYKGEKMGIGTYAFLIRVLNRDGEVITKHGSLTLIR